MPKDPGWQEAVCRPPGLNILKAHQLSEKLHAPLPVGWLAGRTANHFRNWEAITSDKWVLQTVRGYQLEFVNMPTQKQAPMTCASKKLSELISQEIEAMIQKGAVEEVDPRSSVEGFYSRLFLVPKKDGKHRPVINLRPLNAFLRHQHFKMEGIHVVRDLLQQGDWMARIDLKDAYFAVPVCPSDRKYLRFKWQSKGYEFTCLPFGLSTAPRVFTKVLRPVITYLREKGIRCVIYLDDILIMNQDKETLREDVALALTLLEALGFLVNYVKSSLSPVQVLVYLGLVIDSRTRELSLHPDKLHQITAEARHLVKQKEVTGRK